MRAATLATTTALAAILALAAGAAPALAKEGMLARLDAPIALGTPPGTELLVGVIVTVADADGVHPVEGSPIQLVLTGRDGARTRAAGAADGKPGHYVMRIEVPAGGVRQAEVVMHGTSDLPVMLAGDPFTFGPVSARTAQVAPPLAPALTPFPRATAPAAAPVAVAPAVEPAAVAGSTGPSPVLVAGLVALAAVLGLGVLVAAAAARRSRGAARPARPASPDRAPGA